MLIWRLGWASSLPKTLRAARSSTTGATFPKLTGEIDSGHLSGLKQSINHLSEVVTMVRVRLGVPGSTTARWQVNVRLLASGRSLPMSVDVIEPWKGPRWSWA